MGSPKQELLMRDCREVHPHALYMGVGGTMMCLPVVKRAPKYERTWGWSGCIVCFLNRSITRQMRLLLPSLALYWRSLILPSDDEQRLCLWRCSFTT